MTSLIDSFKTHTLDVYRDSGDGRYENGRFVAGTASCVSIDASIQPVTGKEIQRLPSDRQEMENIKLFTKAPLYVNNTMKQTQADVIEYNGYKYEVHSVMDWTRTDLNHYESIASLIAPEKYN